MSDTNDYEDLFESYERRSEKNKGNEQADASKHVGVTTSSSYVKPAHSSQPHKSASSAKSASVKSVAFNKKALSKSKEKKYNKRTEQTNKADQPKSKVKYNYETRKAYAPKKDSIARENTSEKPNSSDAFTNMSKDEYRKKYESRPVQKFTTKKSKSTKSASSNFGGEIADKLKSNDRAKRKLIFIVCVLLAATIVSLISISCLNDVLAINRHSDKAITLTIDTNVDTGDVIKMLKKKGLIKNSIFCNIFAKARGFNNDYETGVFYLKKDMGLEGMLYTLKSTSQTDETESITFPEGVSIIDIAKKLEANNVCSAKNFVDTLDNFTFTYDFLPGSLKTDKSKYEYLEGYLFPSTYDFYVGESPSSVIKKMLDAFDKLYTTDFKNKAKSLGLTCDEVITLASIIQSEAANTEQMGDIASVLYNRIQNPSEYPLLQCDSTTDFLNKDLSDFLKDFPSKGTIDYYALYYSTYSDTFQGLPAGAICNPGADAINAVLNLKSSDYYFFCHDSSGKIHLARTLSEFESIKNEYDITTSTN